VCPRLRGLFALVRSIRRGCRAVSSGGIGTCAAVNSSVLVGARPAVRRRIATGVIRPVALRLNYVIGWMDLRARSRTSEEIEILVLRHLLAMLRRRTPRPRMSRTDHVLIAALTRLLPCGWREHCHGV
jgi:hypothetical protein